MEHLTRNIPLPDGSRVRSVWGIPIDYLPGQSPALILAHGAGTDMDAPLLRYLHETLTGRGVLSVRFNFPYRERGAKLPDRAPALEQTWRAVIDAVDADPELAPGRLLLGGRSMGGRMASHVAAAGAHCDGLALLGYPLHPARKLQRLRNAHFGQLRCPVLFVQGDRDALCDLELLRAALTEIRAPVHLHVIAGADHSFHVLKRIGRSEAQVWQEIVDVLSDWITAPDPVP